MTDAVVPDLELLLPGTAGTSPTNEKKRKTCDLSTPAKDESCGKKVQSLTKKQKSKRKPSPKKESSVAEKAMKDNDEDDSDAEKATKDNSDEDCVLFEGDAEARRRARAVKQRLENAIKRDAAKEVMKVRASKGGEPTTGDIKKIVEMYQKLGYKFITYGKLVYQVSLLSKAPKKIGIMSSTKTTEKTKSLKKSPTSNEAKPGSEIIDIPIDKPRESEEQPRPRKKGGRPKGSLNDKSKSKNRVKAKRLSAILESDKVLNEATSKAAELYLSARENVRIAKESDDNGRTKACKSVPSGTMMEIIASVEKEYDLPPNTINARTVLSRVIRKNPTGQCNQRKPLLEEMEPAVRDYCIQLASSGCYLSKPQVLFIAESYLRRSPELLQRLIDEKKKRKMILDDEENDCDDDNVGDKPKSKSTMEQSLIGIRWFYGFQRRHFEDITRTTGHELQYVSRHFMLRLEHFKNMYDIVYEKMVEAKVAERLNRPSLYDIDGNRIQLTEREWAYGLPTRYKVTKPEYILFVDQVGTRSSYKEQQRLNEQSSPTNINGDDDANDDDENNGDNASAGGGGGAAALKKADRRGLAFYNHVEGQMFELPVDCTNTGTCEETTNMHFSVYCFTDGNGDAVLCAVLLMSDKHINEIPLTVRWGIDMFKPLEEGPTEMDLFERNSSPGQAMQGGPICRYHGHEIPCFVGTSPSGTLESAVLLDICKYLDQLQIYNRATSCGAQPFLLLDGHSNLLDLPFLDYVKGQGHEWTVCVGLPKGSHLLQVADASEFNKSFKSAWHLAKERLLNTRLHHTGRKYFYPSDIIPLIHQSWFNSTFAGKDHKIDDDDDDNEDTSKQQKVALKKAIALRGWNPLNYALLLHPILNKQQQLSEPSTRKKGIVKKGVPLAAATPVIPSIAVATAVATTDTTQDPSDYPTNPDFHCV